MNSDDGKNGKKEDEKYLEINISERQWNIFKNTGKYAGFIFLFIGLYFILGGIDVFSSPVIDPRAGLIIIFVTGLLVSAHCIGMCSGFVFAYSTKTSEDSENQMSKKARMKQHALYNISRLTSYTFFGVIAGLIGATFMLTDQLRGYLSVFAGVFMMLYGLSIFFPRLRKIATIRTPNLTRYTKNRGPVVFGLLNGLMPCGPLQAMLLYSASTGSIIMGGLTMLVFGLGTTPLMFTFGNALTFFTHNFMRKIFKISAIIIMVLGLVTLNRGMLLSGYGLPLPSIGIGSSTGKSSVTGLASATGDFQEINMTVDKYGWDPDTFIVKKGIPVKWHIYVEKLTYCFQGIRVPKYDLRADFTNEGETVTLEFTPKDEGTILFTCWMGMARGDIIVKEDISGAQETKIEKEPGVALIKIRGMCCSGCARYIQSLLLKLDGVESAEVSFEKREATVNFDPTITNVDEIINKIKSTGRYDAQEM